MRPYPIVIFMQPAVIVIVDPLDCVPALSQLALQRVSEKANAGVCSLSIVQSLMRPNDKPPLIREGGGRGKAPPDQEYPSLLWLRLGV